ncbi:hypothetical protein BJY24_007341 [Nocardia transvalensis]|uniref:Uncharacterized protein n=1 Tax=Nocardia transvalensis TaxID=37333 RepID=A0A7W9PLM6_9NOCA|nr:hypothetical protein [Nocardia transvalensis]MBB5918429.1 hypothetical protein [Nocardia transvalensis]
MAIADYRWFPYFQFAAAADTASGEIRKKIDEIAPAVEQFGTGMAGDDTDVGKPWGVSWDTGINQFLPAVCQLADAYGAIANRAYAAGMNFQRAEWAAGGGHGDAPLPPTQPPVNVDQRTVLGNLPSAIGPNGEALVTDIPGLVDQIDKDMPNGHDVKLDEVGGLLRGLRDVVRHHTDEVRRYGREPGSRDSRDAHLLYDEYVKNVLAPSGMLIDDAGTLANGATTFGQELVKQRRDMRDAIQDLTNTAGVTIAVGVAGTFVTASGSDWAAAGVTTARVATTANRIRNLIEVLQAASRRIGTGIAQPRVTAAVVRLIAETINKPLIDFEIDPDTGAIKTRPVFPKWKQDAWERYQADCVNRPSGCMSMEEWSKKYDQLMENSSNGSDWDQDVGELLGYTKENGWKPQQYVADIPGRRYDFVHYNEYGEPDELVENKSGRLDEDQLAKDEQALEDGFKVTYNLKTPVSPSQQASLDRLKAEYGDQFTVNTYY